MPIIRYSAIEQFGVPVENNSTGNAERIAKLMDRHGIEPSVVDLNCDYPIDITPYYWPRPIFRFFLSLVDADNATMDLMPVHDGTQLQNVFTSQVIKGPELSYHVGPANRPGALVGGFSPKFAGRCIHEFVTYVPESILLDS